MNRDNLQKMANHIKTINPDLFNMAKYRNSALDCKIDKINFIGCSIGHCVALDIIDNIPIDIFHNIVFYKWGEMFTDLKSDSKEWQWCFSPYWAKIDNTPQGAAARIEYLLQNGLPHDANEQMLGMTSLIYN